MSASPIEVLHKHWNDPMFVMLEIAANWVSHEQTPLAALVLISEHNIDHNWALDVIESNIMALPKGSKVKPSYYAYLVMNNWYRRTVIQNEWQIQWIVQKERLIEIVDIEAMYKVGYPGNTAVNLFNHTYTKDITTPTWVRLMINSMPERHLDPQNNKEANRLKGFLEAHKTAISVAESYIDKLRGYSTIS